MFSFFSKMRQLISGLPRFVMISDQRTVIPGKLVDQRLADSKINISGLAFSGLHNKFVDQHLADSKKNQRCPPPFNFNFQIQLPPSRSSTTCHSLHTHHFPFPLLLSTSHFNFPLQTVTSTSTITSHFPYPLPASTSNFFPASCPAFTSPPTYLPTSNSYFRFQPSWSD